MATNVEKARRAFLETGGHPRRFDFLLELAELLDDCTDVTDGRWDGTDVCDAVANLAGPAIVFCPGCGAGWAVTRAECPACEVAL